MTLPFGRVDAALVASLATATGVDKVARATATHVDPAIHVAAVRFVDQAILQFTWLEIEVYLTPTDALAFLTSIALLTRFSVWAFGPSVARLLKLFRGS